MKTTQSYLSNIGRYGACIFATLGLSFTAASGATSVTIPLYHVGHNLISNGVNINLNSGLRRLDKATAYTYKVVGNVSCPDTSTTAMSLLVPNPIPLETLLNNFSAGSGSFLHGTYLNPSGTFPIDVVTKVYNKLVPTSFGNATVNLNFRAGVRGGPLDPAREGQVFFTITKVNFVPPPFPIPVGTLQFDPPVNVGGKMVGGAKLIISVKP